MPQSLSRGILLSHRLIVAYSLATKIAINWPMVNLTQLIYAEITHL